MTQITYETRSIYIVKGKSDGHIERVFGNLAQAEMFVSDGGYFIIDEWPVEFKKTIGEQNG